MKLLTWNVNGIRAASIKSKSIKLLLDSLDADIICLQETKITRNLLTTDIGNIDEYLAFFSFSKKRSGYSGVVTYCKKSCCPVAAEEGITGVLCSTEKTQSIGYYPTSFHDEFTTQELKDLDSEGRVIITEHKLEDGRYLCIVNVYCPKAVVDNKERYEFKMKFYHLLEMRCRHLEKAGKHVMVVGDLNVSHQRIDHCDPHQDFEASRSRKWFNSIIIRNTRILKTHQHESLSEFNSKDESYHDLSEGRKTSSSSNNRIFVKTQEVSATVENDLNDADSKTDFPCTHAINNIDISEAKNSKLMESSEFRAIKSLRIRNSDITDDDGGRQFGDHDDVLELKTQIKKKELSNSKYNDTKNSNDEEQSSNKLQSMNGLKSSSLAKTVSIDFCESFSPPSNEDTPHSQYDNSDCDDGKQQFCDDFHFVEDSLKTPFLVDVFRAMHPTRREAFTCWNTKERARETNYGTRIDYVLTTRDFYESDAIEWCDIRPDIYGSDHCPVECSLKCSFSTSSIIPSTCVIFMPELSGKQQNIKTYFANSVTASNGKRLSGDICQNFDNSSNKRLKLCRLNDKKVSKTKKDNLLAYFDSSGKGKCLENTTGLISKSNADVKSFETIDKNFDNITKLKRLQSLSNDKSKTTKWKGIFKGPEPVPKCSGHNEPCILQTVKKEGPNIGRQFYCCKRPSGHATNKEARCKFFKWKNK
ncbi:DNA-(apurinic or apyrimidinic site) endonuclease 2-like [Clytia hemisphaerica]|uniref:DNA-(apurinic or apyrimidinic site) endonuclease 2 n=1 Tax=Clytia hemisphaerica TaxID=252671 RepID=A0A7M5WJX9_9CNID